jgi:hypothetical protein
MPAILRYSIPPLIAVGLPALGYGLTFVYEWGFFNVFKIPAAFIELSVADVVFVIFVVIIYLGGAFLIGYVLIFRYIVKCPAVIRDTLWAPAGGLLITVFLAIIYRDASEAWKYLLVAWPIAWAIFYGPTHCRWGKTKRQALTKTDGQKRDNTLSGRETQQGSKAIGNKKEQSADLPKGIGIAHIGWVTILLVALLCLSSYAIGDSTALRQNRYLIPSSNSNSVVLRRYGATLICVPIAREVVTQNSKIFNQFKAAGDIFILNTERNPNLILTLEETGRLAR